jgi:hypothetical protein
MILFDLLCREGHRFEAWFRSGDAFEEQQADGGIHCPVCDVAEVSKVPTGAHVRRSRPDGPVVEADGQRNFGEMLAAIRRMVETRCDYVGDAFPDEARRIFHGEVAAREIYGEASTEDADEMREEGIEVYPIPWMRRSDG